jgi:hypothetical protein
MGGTLLQVTAFAPSKTFDTLNLRGATLAFQPE